MRSIASFIVFVLLALPAMAQTSVIVPEDNAPGGAVLVERPPQREPGQSGPNPPTMGDPGIMPGTVSDMPGQSGGGGQAVPMPRGGLPQACTQMWCQEGLTINFTRQVWPPGLYRIAVTADGRTTMCEGRLPYASCDQPGFRCAGALEVQVGESGCALPPSEQGLYGLVLKVPPKHVQLMIQRNGRPVVSYNGVINGQCAYPNGPQCDPRPCCSAQLDLTPVW